MKWPEWFLSTIIVLILVAGVAIGGFFFWRYFQNQKSSTVSSSPTPSTSISRSASPTISPSETPAPALVYPISNFLSRATTNLFGTYYPPGGSTNPDRKACPGATYYSGYHTAVDLETTTAEADQNVAVFAIAAGTVRFAGSASGYGGLIIVQYNLGGSDYTGIYGHLDQSTFKVKVGDSVSVGETLASLGAACSSSNGDVRKHLHFGLHKGTAIDEAGYVSSQSALSAWTDPLVLLKSLGAVQG